MRDKKPSGIKTRKTNHIPPNPKILIVCEGETEKIYFTQLIHKMRWNAIRVKAINSPNGPAPISVVTSAIEIQESEIKNHGNDSKFDNLFCLIDQDSHYSHKQAEVKAKEYNKLRVKDLNNDVFLTRVFSAPCFEYWLLLHFSRKTKAYVRTHNKSICDLCRSDLKVCHKSLANYDKAKNINDYMDLFIKSLSHAQSNANSARDIAQSRGDTNPYTEVDLLITYLKELSCHSIEKNSQINFNKLPNIGW